MSDILRMLMAGPGARAQRHYREGWERIFERRSPHEEHVEHCASCRKEDEQEERVEKLEEFARDVLEKGGHFKLCTALSADPWAAKWCNCGWERVEAAARDALGLPKTQGEAP